MSSMKDKPDTREPIIGARYPPEIKKEIQEMVDRDGLTVSKVLIVIAKYGLPALATSRKQEVAEVIQFMQSDEVLSPADAVCRLIEEGAKAFKKSKKHGKDE